MEDNKYHPNQGMADAMTPGSTWDGPAGAQIAVSGLFAEHQEAHRAASRLHVCRVVLRPRHRFAHPPELRIDPEVEQAIKANLEANGGSYEVVDDMDAARGPMSSMPRTMSASTFCLLAAEPQHDEMAKLFDKAIRPDRTSAA